MNQPINVDNDLEKDEQNINNGISNASKRTYWDLFGRKFPKSEFLFFAQTILIYIVVCVSLYNLTAHNVDKSNDKLWIALLSSSVGYILPNPSFTSNSLK